MSMIQKVFNRTNRWLLLAALAIILWLFRAVHFGVFQGKSWILLIIILVSIYFYRQNKNKHENT